MWVRLLQLVLSAPTGFSVSNSPVTTSGTLSLSFATGYSLPTSASQITWDTAYNNSIISASVTGTETKLLTLTQQDGGTITASWSDFDTAPVTSVFGRLGAIIAQLGDYTTTLVTEGTNLYFTDSRARQSISLTTIGTNGPATYSNVTGVFNIPNYSTDLTGYVPYTGANQTVNLNTQQLQAGHTTLTTNGSTETLTINHTSGSGKAINVTKGGNGEGLYINKTSGSGNAATIVGTLEATTLVKTGGTSAQFLKADGSVDSTSYGTVSSVAALTLGTSGTDLSSSVVNSTTTPVITLNVPTASAVNRGALSAADWTTFNSKQPAGNYVTTDTTQTITGFKTILRGGDVLNFKIGTDTLYGLKVAYNQNELVPSGEATWSFVNTFNRNGTGYETTPISFFRGVLVTGQRLLSASVNTNLLDYYSNNPSGRYPIYAYNTGVQQFASSIIVGETTGVVDAITGAIADLPAGVVANFKGRVIGSDAVNNNEFATLGQVTSTSRAAISLTTTGTSGPATYSSVTGVLNIPEYQGGVTSFNTRTGAVTLTSSDVTTALGYTPVTDARTLTINGVTYDLTANRTWTVGVNPSAREIETFIATSGQTVFTVTGGYTVGLVDVYINGVRLTSSDYTATNGTTVVLTVGTMVGNIVDIIKYTSGFTNPIAGTLSTGQVAFGTATNTIGGDNGLFWDNVNKRLGVGTNVVDVKFHVVGSEIKLQAQGQLGSTFLFNGGNNTSINSDVNYANIKSLVTSGTTNFESGVLTFETRNSGTIAERWRITNLGILQSNGAQTIQTSSGALTLQPSNNVLIGTTTDNGARLQVSGTATVSGTSGAFIGVTINNTDSTGSARLRVTSTGGNINDLSSFSASHPSRANQAWIGGDGSSIVTVLQAGGVEFLRGASTGAATFSSSIASSISGSGDNIFLLATGTGTGARTAYIANDGAAAVFGIEKAAGGAILGGGLAYATVLFSNNATPLQFGTNQTARMTITSTGKIGINNNIGYNQLDLKGTNTNGSVLEGLAGFYRNTAIGGALLISASDTSADIAATWYSGATNMDLTFTTVPSSGTYFERMRIKSSGNVLIGTTTDSGYKLRVNGSVLAGNHVVTSGSTAPALNATGTLASGVSYAIIAIYETTNTGKGCILLMAAGVLTLVSNPSGDYTTTVNTANKWNVTVSSGVISIQNNRASGDAFNATINRLD